MIFFHCKDDPARSVGHAIATTGFVIPHSCAESAATWACWLCTSAQSLKISVISKRVDHSNSMASVTHNNQQPQHLHQLR
ncbi:hypothetical protein IF2G_10335 [Cordyceps javanica]|nr:hypothetical protein IF2G_10335 [Cordyceps javanica]